MSATQLQHVRVHGLGLTDDFLLQLSDRAQTAQLDTAAPATYDLPPRTSLEEAIQDAWDDARKAWLKHQSHQTDSWAGWVRPLLKTLDYSFVGGGAAGGKYAVNHLTETGDVPLHFTRQADLDRVTDETGLRVSPHGLMQGYLNATPGHLWGLVTNGETLRVLRDHAQVTRPAYVEFQIGEMLRTEDARAFRVLWLLLHRTRLRGSQTILETWNEASKVLGQRANDTLRDGVQLAIERLGTGFLQRNPDLLERTRSGAVTTHDLYRAALTTVYQMVFLFVTEDRDLLFARDEQGDYVPDAQTRGRAAHYLTRTLRQKAGTLHGHPTHTDAYAGWERLLTHLRTGFPALGLPALGSLLFQPNLLSGLRLDNESFYSAVRALSEIRVNGSLRPVNYAGLDSEELGSIYESLLELVPRIEPGPRLMLSVLPGNERKSTGSYYTPSGLIGLLLDSALDPVIEDATRDKLPHDAMNALKGLKVIDPACGSGHFLIAAARRIGARLAELEEETSVPSPRALRKATRTVIAHCIYGADINPMAIELAKVALWLESQDAGKPLAFLDHRLRVGNSLLGTTPELMNAEDEIAAKTVRGVTSRAVKAHTLHLPDAAFSPIEGDDRSTVTALKRRNKQEREFQIKAAHGAQTLFSAADDLAPVSAIYRALDKIEPEALANVQAQESTFAAIRDNQTLKRQKLLADAWCAAFVTPKVPDVTGITTATLNALKQNPDAPALADVRVMAQATAEQYRFLHPHIEFPDVFTPEQGGFDCVLGNPPWEQVQLDPQEFFASTHPDIANAENMAAREQLIAELEHADELAYAQYLAARREMEGTQHFIHTSGKFPTTSFGRINTAPLFSEFSMQSISKRGMMGIIVPTGIATDSFNQYFFNSLVDSRRLRSLYDFENREGLFPGVHRSFKFCTLTVGGQNRTTEQADFTFFATRPEDVQDPSNRFQLSPQDIALLNPNTRTTPIFRSARDANLTKVIYQRVPVLLREAQTIIQNGQEVVLPEENPWGIKFMLMFMMNTGSRIFKNRTQLEADGWELNGNRYRKGDAQMLPLYEAKLMHQFDHRYATYTESGDTRDMTGEEKADPTTVAMPRYWVAKTEVEERLLQRDRSGTVTWQWDRNWLMGWRDIARSTDERTGIFSVEPRAAIGHTNPVFFTGEHPVAQLALISNMNSYVTDYAARQKIGGTHLTFGFLKQFPILPPSSLTPARLAFITPRVLELTYTAFDLAGFARDLHYSGDPFTWNDERRFWLRAELDALYFILYGIGRDDVDYIMDTFPIVKRKDMAAHGAYRTKDAILAIYDELQTLGLDRLGDYRSRVLTLGLDGGDVAGGWRPA